jgi:hypothetical protein
MTTTATRSKAIDNLDPGDSTETNWPPSSASEAAVDPDLINAGKIPVTEPPGASYFHHAVFDIDSDAVRVRETFGISISDLRACMAIELS